MAITSVGYDGSVSEVQWSQMIWNVGSSPYGVVGVNDWKVTSHATLDKGVNIAAGVGYGRGIYDVNSATATVAGAALASGTRYDMVVAKRDWTGAGGTTTFRIITGTASRTMPSRAQTPGSVDEQPLALLRFDAGQTHPTEIVDLRVWSGPGGAMAADDMALGYLAAPGARVFIGSADWTCVIASGVASWRVSGGETRFSMLNPVPALWSCTGDVMVSNFGAGKKVEMLLKVKRTGGNIAVGAASHSSIGIVTPQQARGNAGMYGYYPISVVGPGAPAYTGSLSFDPGSGLIGIKFQVATTVTQGSIFNFSCVYYF